MRTLHKGLAMLLAVVMVLGIGAFNVFAMTSRDYTDGASIDADYKEAVDVLSTIGVLNGFDDDGDGKYEFQPTGTLTRGQAAKVICCILGVTNPTGTSTFADGDWADAYIAYIEAQGITNGITMEGEYPRLFGTNNYLTGYQFAKWLLVGLGYDADIEEMTGYGWELATQKLLNRTDLDHKLPLTYNLNDNLTREMAMQMALNALETPMVEYNGGFEVNGVKVNADRDYVTTNASYGKNIDGDTDGEKGPYYVELGEQYWKTLKVESSGTTDKLGRPARTWSFDNKSIGTYTDSSDLVVSYTKEIKQKDLYKDIGSSDAYNIAKDVEFSVYRNGEDLKVKNGAGYVVKDGDTVVPGTGNGVLTELYRTENKDGDNEYSLVVIESYLVQATADYSASAGSVKVASIVGSAGISEIKQENANVSNVKKDDYLVITVGKEDGKKVAVTAEPAAVVEGEVTAFTTEANSNNYYKNTVTIGGTKYNYNRNALSTDKGYGATYKTGTNAVVILDSYNNIFYVKEAQAGSSGNYLFVTDRDLYLGDVTAKAYFLDGTSQEIAVKDGLTKSSGTENNWFHYELDGAKYKLENSTTKDTKYNVYNYSKTTGIAPGDLLIDDGKAQFLQVGSHTSYVGDSNTVVLTKDGNNVKAYKGVSNLPEIKANSDSVKVYYAIENGAIRYVFIDGKVSVKGSDANTDLLFVVSAGNTGDDGNGVKYKEYKVILNGALEGKFRTKDNNSLSTNTLYTDLRYDNNGLLEAQTKVEAGGDKVHAGSGVGTITMTNDDVMTLVYNDTTATLLIGNANVNLIKGTKDEEILASTTAKTLAEDAAIKNKTVDYVWFAQYTADPSATTGSGEVKALYIALTGTPVATQASDLDAQIAALQASGGGKIPVTTTASIANGVPEDVEISVQESAVLTLAGDIEGTVSCDSANAEIKIEGEANVKTAQSLHINKGKLNVTGTLKVSNGGYIEIAKTATVVELKVLVIEDANSKVDLSANATIKTLSITKGALNIKAGNAVIENVDTVGEGDDKGTITKSGDATLAAPESVEEELVEAGVIADNVVDNNDVEVEPDQPAASNGTIKVTGGLVTTEGTYSSGTYTISVDAVTAGMVKEVTLVDASAADISVNVGTSGATFETADNKVTITFATVPAAGWEITISKVSS